MPSCSAFALSLALAAAVRTLPVDDISARNGIGSASSGVGGQAAGGSVFAAAGSCAGTSTECAISELSGITLAKIASGKGAKIISCTSMLTLIAENAGNGGSALSGTSDGKGLFSFIGGTNSTSKIPQGSGFSGAGGEAPGGSVTDSHPALIELDSDNAGRGGNASSGNSSGLVA